MIKQYELETPMDLNQSAIEEALSKLGWNAPYYILNCHVTNMTLAKWLREKFQRQGLDIGVALHDEDNRHAWRLNAFNNYGPPFLLGYVNSNPID